MVRFVQQNLLPRVNEVTMDNLLSLREHDGRPIGLAILRDDLSIPSVSFIRMLRDLAPRNQAFIFAHVDSVKFPSFTDTFHIDNKSILPRFIIWDGHSTYFEVSIQLQLFLATIKIILWFKYEELLGKAIFRPSSDMKKQNFPEKAKFMPLV